MLKWVTVDEKYLDYLRTNVDPHVPMTNYGPNRLKPFFGVLFETADFAYVTQVSHPQPRHQKIKSGLTFLKVFNQNALICVVNLNHMFPVPKSRIREMLYSDIEQYRTFSSIKEKNDYIALLKTEMRIMQTMDIGKKALKLYNICQNYPENAVAKTCMQFTKLEEACAEYYR